MLIYESNVKQWFLLKTKQNKTKQKGKRSQMTQTQTHNRISQDMEWKGQIMSIPRTNSWSNSYPGLTVAFIREACPMEEVISRGYKRGKIMKRKVLSLRLNIYTLMVSQMLSRNCTLQATFSGDIDNYSMRSHPVNYSSNHVTQLNHIIFRNPATQIWALITF